MGFVVVDTSCAWYSYSFYNSFMDSSEWNIMNKEEIKMWKCEECGEEFNNPRPKRFCSNKCNTKNWYKNNKEKHQAKNRRFFYGMTSREYDSLLIDQDFRCAVCGRHKNEFIRCLAVDHNHKTGEIRGLLCSRCNRALGWWYDNPLLLIKATKYLKTRKKIMWVCEKCGEEIIEDTGGYLVCNSCGEMYGKVYSNKDDPVYENGTNNSHHHIRNRNYRTKINLEECKNSNLKRIIKKVVLRTWDVLKTDLVHVEMSRICGLLNLNNIVKDCFHLFEKINRNVSFSKREQTMEDVAAAIIYLQSRLYGKPVFLRDFEKIGFSKKNILSYYMNWVEKLKFKVKPQTPKLIVNRIINSFVDDNPITFRSKFLMIKESIQLAEKYYYLGNYIITCGACVYIKSKEFGFGITQKEIRELIGCSHQTLISYIQKISKLEINL